MGNGESDLELANLRDVIQHYLMKNPNAADSLQGIMSWWLPFMYGKVEAARVKQVLEQLIAEGVVRKVTLVDGTILFRRREPRN